MLGWLASGLIWALLGALCVVGTVAAGCVQLWGGARRRARLQSIARLVWGRAPFGLIPSWSLSIEGLENLPATGPVVICANHESILDVPVLLALPRPFCQITSDRWLSVPFFGRFAGWLGAIGVRPEDPASVRLMLDRARAALDRGMAVALYPEGTRSRDGAVGRFQPGGFRLAREAGAPVVPVALSGTGAYLPPGRATRARRRLTARMVILPPLDPAGFRGVRSLARATREAIVAALDDA